MRTKPRRRLDWRKALIYTHRWVGTALTGVFVTWFVSGVVFVYIGMPALPAEERLRRLEPLDLAALRITPVEAVSRLKLATPPSRVRIGMFDSRPVYRLQSGPGWRMVYADTGEPLAALSEAEAMAVMSRYVPEHAATLRYERHLLDADQWTLQGVIRANLPMHRIALGDASGTEYYVSDRTGEPVLRTTSKGRWWGYAGPVLHWFYFPPLRRQVTLWNGVVVWISLIGAVMCALGIVIGVWRYSIAGRRCLRGARAHTPYTDSMRWHHYVGLVFGLFACTWAFSGAMSLSPFAFLRSPAPTRALTESASGGAIDLAPLTIDRIRAVAATVGRSFAPKELDFFQFLGEPYFIAYVPPTPSESPPWRNTDIAAATALNIDRAFVLVSALRPEEGTFTSFGRERMWDVTRAAMPRVPVEDSVWLQEYDAYYYSREHLMPLPVLRVRYLDPQRTWLYLDPERGVIAARYDRPSRWSRWLFNGLHSLDFPFMYYRRPLWDIVVIVLSLGGVGISLTSALPAWRRLVSHAGRWSGSRSSERSG